VARSYRLTATARTALRSQREWLAERNPLAAMRLLGRLEEALTLLTEGLLEGPTTRLRTGRSVRKWVVAPLVLYYVRRDHEVIVLRVRHGAQRPIAR
jgi:plasmid stabilization system protein ParE